MARSWTGETLISRVENITLMPTSQGTITDAQLLDMLNEELYDYVTPFLLEHHSDYLLTYQDITLVSGQTEYDLPSDAMGDKLHDVKRIYANGSEESIPRRMTGMGDRRWSNTATVPSWFMIRGNTLVLPTHTGSGSDPGVRLYYYRRPAPIATSTSMALITSVDTGAGTVSYASTSGLNGATVDFQRGDGLYDWRVQELSGSATATIFTATTSGDIASNSIAANDYIVTSGYAAVPQIPRELVPLLCYRTAINIQRARGLEQLAQSLELKASQLENRIRSVFINRVNSEPPALFNPNSPLRVMRQRRWRW